MDAQTIYRVALGIEIGDIVMTSYDTGPYEIDSISDPYVYERYGSELYIFSAPCVGVSCFPIDAVRIESNRCYINDIRQVGERWFTRRGDEVYVQKPAARPSMPVDMFYSYPPVPPLRTFDPTVDYTQHAWTCEKCERDFNWTPPERYAMPRCLHCNHWSCLRIRLPNDSAAFYHWQAIEVMI